MQGGNLLGPNGASALARALEKMTGLTMLWLVSEPWAGSGGVALVSAVLQPEVGDWCSVP